jgi:phosphoglycerate dehydrogenase-like enzyme
MSKKPRVLLLNGTCHDVVGSHCEWLKEVDIDLIVWPRCRNASLDDLASDVVDVAAVIGPTVHPITAAQMYRCRWLRHISLAASGYDSVDVNAATAVGIVVTNAMAPEGAEVVADLAWGLLLAVSRQICRHDRQIRSGNFSRSMGSSPWGKTLGIVGLGQIGRSVARRATGFDMKILATEPRPDANFVAQHSVTLLGLEELLTHSDFVSLHVRLDDSTRSMIGAAQLARMKPTAYLINSARRELVDEQALAAALRNGTLAGAALDDPPADRFSEMLSMDNVVFTPHIGNRARDGVDAVFRRAVTNAADVLAGRPCRYIVNREALRFGARPARMQS